ncbi:hypothetical protein HYFRA_00007086 [Hymenoscyphus fraxineus]|uniref:Mediator of RNA polymerase II transcription subunit 10 n=1 Tax=Hymenoscyphus fraxineus TaxID=746836 RepID=A0A9N9PV04_9HELO|nr:hypothetical protein HYFRA_00007086 [Hymenoscyphus fraxineus]
MAPVGGSSDHDVVEKQVKEIIQDLYQVMVQIQTYDTAGVPTAGVLEQQMIDVSSSLQKIHASTSTVPSNQPKVKLPSIPPELFKYVDSGRNPDIYTREFVELTRRGNQLMKGKEEAFGSFRDVLAQEMVKGMPECKEDVRRILEETGGRGGLVDG